MLKIGNGGDTKKRKKGDEEEEEENPKRAKVHAQRKFAAGASNPSSLAPTPVKEDGGRGCTTPVSNVLTAPDMLPLKTPPPKTEDFLTFLCFRRTPFLPSQYEFFNAAPIPETPSLSPSRSQSPVQGDPPSSRSAAKPQGARLIRDTRATLVAVKRELRNTLLRKKSVGRTQLAASKLRNKYRQQQQTRRDTRSKPVQKRPVRKVVKKKAVAVPTKGRPSATAIIAKRRRKPPKVTPVSPTNRFAHVLKRLGIPVKSGSNSRARRPARVTRSAGGLRTLRPPTAKSKASQETKAAAKKLPGRTKERPASKDRNASKERNTSKDRNANRDRNSSKDRNANKDRNTSRDRNASKERNASKDRNTSRERPSSKERPKPMSPPASKGVDVRRMTRSFQLTQPGQQRRRLLEARKRILQQRIHRVKRPPPRREPTPPPASTSSGRPTRRTKEAAAMYLELIGKRLSAPEDDDDNISITSLSEFRVISMTPKEMGDDRDTRSSSPEKKSSSPDKRSVVEKKSASSVKKSASLSAKKSASSSAKKLIPSSSKKPIPSAKKTEKSPSLNTRSSGSSPERKASVLVRKKSDLKTATKSVEKAKQFIEKRKTKPVISDSSDEESQVERRKSSRVLDRRKREIVKTARQRRLEQLRRTQRLSKEKTKESPVSRTKPQTKRNKEETSSEEEEITLSQKAKTGKESSAGGKGHASTNLSKGSASSSLSNLSSRDTRSSRESLKEEKTTKGEKKKEEKAKQPKDKQVAVKVEEKSKEDKKDGDVKGKSAKKATKDSASHPKPEDKDSDNKKVLKDGKSPKERKKGHPSTEEKPVVDEEVAAKSSKSEKTVASKKVEQSKSTKSEQKTPKTSQPSGKSQQVAEIKIRPRSPVKNEAGAKKTEDKETKVKAKTEDDKASKATKSTAKGKGGKGEETKVQSIEGINLKASVRVTKLKPKSDGKKSTEGATDKESNSSSSKKIKSGAGSSKTEAKGESTAKKENADSKRGDNKKECTSSSSKKPSDAKEKEKSGPSENKGMKKEGRGQSKSEASSSTTNLFLQKDIFQCGITPSPFTSFAKLTKGLSLNYMDKFPHLNSLKNNMKVNSKEIFAKEPNHFKVKDKQNITQDGSEQPKKNDRSNITKVKSLEKLVNRLQAEKQLKTDDCKSVQEEPLNYSRDSKEVKTSQESSQQPLNFVSHSRSKFVAEAVPEELLQKLKPKPSKGKFTKPEKRAVKKEGGKHKCQDKDLGLRLRKSSAETEKETDDELSDEDSSASESSAARISLGNCQRKSLTLVKGWFQGEPPIRHMSMLSIPHPPGSVKSSKLLKKIQMKRKREALKKNGKSKLVEDIDQLVAGKLRKWSMKCLDEGSEEVSGKTVENNSQEKTDKSSLKTDKEESLKESIEEEKVEQSDNNISEKMTSGKPSEELIVPGKSSNETKSSEVNKINKVATDMLKLCKPVVLRVEDIPRVIIEKTEKVKQTTTKKEKSEVSKSAKPEKEKEKVKPMRKKSISRIEMEQLVKMSSDKSKAVVGSQMETSKVEKEKQSVSLKDNKKDGVLTKTIGELNNPRKESTPKKTAEPSNSSVDSSLPSKKKCKYTDASGSVALQKDVREENKDDKTKVFSDPSVEESQKVETEDQPEKINEEEQEVQAQEIVYSDVEIIEEDGNDTHALRKQESDEKPSDKQIYINKDIHKGEGNLEKSLSKSSDLNNLKNAKDSATSQTMENLGANEPQQSKNSEEYSMASQAETATEESNKVNWIEIGTESSKMVNQEDTAIEQNNQAETTMEDSNRVNEAGTATEDSNKVNEAGTATEDSNKLNEAETATEHGNQAEMATEESNRVNQAETATEESNQVNQAETAIEEIHPLCSPKEYRNSDLPQQEEDVDVCVVSPPETFESKSIVPCAKTTSISATILASPNNVLGTTSLKGRKDALPLATIAPQSIKNMSSAIAKPFCRDANENVANSLPLVTSGGSDFSGGYEVSASQVSFFHHIPSGYSGDVNTSENEGFRKDSTSSLYEERPISSVPQEIFHRNVIEVGKNLNGQNSEVGHSSTEGKSYSFNTMTEVPGESSEKSGGITIYPEETSGKNVCVVEAQNAVESSSSTATAYNPMPDCQIVSVSEPVIRKDSSLAVTVPTIPSSLVAYQGPTSVATTLPAPILPNAITVGSISILELRPPSGDVKTAPVPAVAPVGPFLFRPIIAQGAAPMPIVSSFGTALRPNIGALSVVRPMGSTAAGVSANSIITPEGFATNLQSYLRPLAPLCTSASAVNITFKTTANEGTQIGIVRPRFSQAVIRPMTTVSSIPQTVGSIPVLSGFNQPLMPLVQPVRPTVSIVAPQTAKPPEIGKQPIPIVTPYLPIPVAKANPTVGVALPIGVAAACQPAIAMSSKPKLLADLPNASQAIQVVQPFVTTAAKPRMANSNAGVVPSNMLTQPSLPAPLTYTNASQAPPYSLPTSVMIAQHNTSQSSVASTTTATLTTPIMQVMPNIMPSEVIQVSTASSSGEAPPQTRPQPLIFQYYQPSSSSAVVSTTDVVVPDSQITSYPEIKIPETYPEIKIPETYPEIKIPETYPEIKIPETTSSLNCSFSQNLAAILPLNKDVAAPAAPIAQEELQTDKETENVLSSTASTGTQSDVGIATDFPEPPPQKSQDALESPNSTPTPKENEPHGSPVTVKANKTSTASNQSSKFSPGGLKGRVLETSPLGRVKAQPRIGTSFVQEKSWMKKLSARKNQNKISPTTAFSAFDEKSVYAFDDDADSPLEPAYRSKNEPSYSKKSKSEEQEQIPKKKETSSKNKRKSISEESIKESPAKKEEFKSCGSVTRDKEVNENVCTDSVNRNPVKKAETSPAETLQGKAIDSSKELAKNHVDSIKLEQSKSVEPANSSNSVQRKSSNAETSGSPSDPAYRGPSKPEGTAAVDSIKLEQSKSVEPANSSRLHSVQRKSSSPSDPAYRGPSKPEGTAAVDKRQSKHAATDNPKPPTSSQSKNTSTKVHMPVQRGHANNAGTNSIENFRAPAFDSVQSKIASTSSVEITKVRALEPMQKGQSNNAITNLVENLRAPTFDSMQSKSIGSVEISKVRAFEQVQRGQSSNAPTNPVENVRASAFDSMQNKTSGTSAVEISKVRTLEPMQRMQNKNSVTNPVEISKITVLDSMQRAHNSNAGAAAAVDRSKFAVFEPVQREQSRNVGTNSLGHSRVRAFHPMQRGQVRHPSTEPPLGHSRVRPFGSMQRGPNRIGSGNTVANPRMGAFEPLQREQSRSTGTEPVAHPRVGGFEPVQREPSRSIGTNDVGNPRLSAFEPVQRGQNKNASTDPVGSSRVSAFERVQRGPNIDRSTDRPDASFGQPYRDLSKNVSTSASRSHPVEQGFKERTDVADVTRQPVYSPRSKTAGTDTMPSYDNRHKNAATDPVDCATQSLEHRHISTGTTPHIQPEKPRTLNLVPDIAIKREPGKERSPELEIIAEFPGRNRDQGTSPPPAPPPPVLQVSECTAPPQSKEASTSSGHQAAPKKQGKSVACQVNMDDPEESENETLSEPEPPQKSSEISTQTEPCSEISKVLKGKESRNEATTVKATSKVAASRTDQSLDTTDRKLVMKTKLLNKKRRDEAFDLDHSTDSDQSEPKRQYLRKASTASRHSSISYSDSESAQESGSESGRSVDRKRPPSYDSSDGKAKRPKPQLKVKCPRAPLPKTSKRTRFPCPGDATGQLVDAPLFRPSEADFQDPLEYLEKIRSQAESFGVCVIQPPSSFKPECSVIDDMRFMVYNQHIHKMQHRWGPSAREMAAICKLLSNQDIDLQYMPWIGGVEMDLPRLYNTVRSLGGLQEVIRKSKWAKVADMMKISKNTNDRVNKLYDMYCKYLLPYETLRKDERETLLLDADREFEERQKERKENPGADEEEDEIDECVKKGRTLPLAQFYRIARNIQQSWFSEKEPTSEEVENEYWSIVTERTLHVCVNAASIDSGACGYGFACGKNSPFAKHPWNLKMLTNNPDNVLRSMGPLMGVTTPTLHVNMLFSTGCWYRDPHCLPWVEYLHTGANKIWYAVPPSHGREFKKTVSAVIPEHVKDAPLWLPSDTAVVPPDVLLENGVSLTRVVQEPGQFVVVFPRSFTSTICTGYLLSESVYYAHEDWINVSQRAFKAMRDSMEPSMFSIERLLFSIASDSRFSASVLARVLPLIENIREEEVTLRAQLRSLDLVRRERLPLPTPAWKRGRAAAAQDDDEYEQECDTCYKNLYLSLVENTEEETVYCLEHAVEHLSSKPGLVKKCTLMYAYSEAELDEVIVKVQARVESGNLRKGGATKRRERGSPIPGSS